MPEHLQVEDLSAGYGDAIILEAVSFKLEAGRALAVLGRNGSGKSTLMQTLVGLTQQHGGRVLLGKRDLTNLPPHQRAAAGVGWVPQERRVFKSLTVDEHLRAVARPGYWDAARIYTQFPRLAERRAHLGDQLSGGEQQMLAISRALMLNPRLLLLDEPLEGLAPLIVTELLTALRQIVRDHGLSAIIVEHQAQAILDITDRAIVLERGRIRLSETSATLAAAPDQLTHYLSVGAPER